MSNLYFNFFIFFIFISYLFYFNFLITFFSFFSDNSTFLKNGWLSLNQTIHGPLKWSYGLTDRDHFSYHKGTTIFWLKNDPLISASMLLLNLFIFFYLFFLFLINTAILRLLTFKYNFSYNNFTFFYSLIKNFFYLLLFIFFLILLCFLYQFIRFPFELYWLNKFVFIMHLFVEFFFDLFI